MTEEVPWPAEPIEAELHWSSDDLGHLHFIGPDGERAVVPVTPGPTQSDPIRWHVDIHDDQGAVEGPGREMRWATVSPSIHYIDKWHSPNPARFMLVESIDG